MARPKRVNLGEIRYPARNASHSCDDNEQHPAHMAWMFAKFEVDYLYDLLIDLRSGHAASENSCRKSGDSRSPLPAESEIHDCLKKSSTQDCALQRATKRFSHPYRRKHSPATVIAVRNAVYKSIRGQIDEGISPDPMAPDYSLFRVVAGHTGCTLPKTSEQYERDTEIALEIEEELNLKKHPDLKPETRRITVLIKETSLAHDDWDQFLWSDFLDSVFTHSTRFTIEVTLADLGPNKPSPRQKIGAPVKPDTQILRRIQRQTARTACQNIGRAYISDAFIDEFLRNAKT